MQHIRPTVKLATVRKLEDSFFAAQDQQLIDQLRTIKKLKETKAELGRVSGIKDDRVLDKLVQLNVRPETLAALSLVPLVEVAWADGEVDEKETQAVMQVAKDIIKGDNALALNLLDEWLKHRPPKDMLDAWREYTRGLCEHLPTAITKALKKELLERARSIAGASGGFLGMGNRISEEELRMLNALEDAFPG